LFDEVVRGQRRMIVKKGRRDYRLGRTQVISSNEDPPRTLEIDIKSITYLQVRNLVRIDAINGGLDPFNALIREILDSYPDVTEDTEVTKVVFSVPIESLASHFAIEFRASHFARI
jgi:hypothetical protein